MVSQQEELGRVRSGHNGGGLLHGVDGTWDGNKGNHEADNVYATTIARGVSALVRRTQQCSRLGHSGSEMG